uniref:LolYLWa n=1 Tax=Bichromomyia olmeca TaxID=715919 RepID=A0A1B1V3H8_9DIPT|nr:LolYLWa [Bichromomyia olmeca]
MIMFCLIICTLLLLQGIFGADVSKGYMWNHISLEDIDKGAYDPSHILPTAFAHDANDHTMYLAIPRKVSDIPYTLAEFDTTKNPGVEGNQEPLVHRFSGHKTGKELTSIYQPVIDECRRMWIVDVGVVEYTEDPKVHPIRNPSIVAYDLKTPGRPEVVRYDFPDISAEKPSFFGGFTVDVVNPSGDCSNTFVYITNFDTNALIIYDQKNNQFWKVSDPSFAPDVKSTFKHAGKEYKYEFGLFAITLGDRDNEGNRPAYYLAGSSHKVYSVNTNQLKQKGATLSPVLLGERGEHSDAIALVYDSNTKVIFFAESNTGKITCWNSQKKPLKPENTHAIFNNEDFIFMTDISVDSKGTLWFMANGMPPIDNSHNFQYEKPRFRVMQVDTKTAIAGTNCE